MKNYKDLIVWQKSLKLSFNIYDITKKFPNDEKFGLVSQMRRCAVSAPSNIAEGHGRNSDKEFIQFCYIARGSCNELETQILISEKNKYISADTSILLQKNTEEILKMLSALIKKLNS